MQHERELIIPAELIAGGGILFAVAFQESRGRNYPIALSMAKTASLYREIDFDSVMLHFAGFKNDLGDLARAAVLLKMVSSWRGSTVFAGAKGTMSPWNAMEVLNCYTSALAANRGPSAHCLIRDSKYGYIHPCKFLYSRTSRPDPLIPASLEDQIRDAAISRGADWCPFLLK